MHELTGFMTGQVSYSLVALLLRLMVIICLIPYGIKKLTQWHDSHEHFPAVLGLSAEMSFYMALFAETMAPFALLIGLFTRLAAIGGIINMSVAYLTYIKFPVHKNDPYYFAPSLPILLGYVLVLIMGPGAFSLDYIFF